jgi:hypothetical protein
MRPPANKNQANQKISSVLSSLFTAMLGLAVLAILAAVFVWNWDGFWQTDIKRLNSVQQRYFPAKFDEEQLKLSRILDNSKVLKAIETRLVKAEAEVERERQRASNSQLELKALVAEENTKCQYYKTSLKIIENLTGKLSPADLQALVKCTNQECEQIIKSTPEATAICG